MVIPILHFPFVQFLLGPERKGRGAAAGPVPLARKYKSTRTARGHTGAGNNIMGRQETTIFASLGGVRRCRGQAFFNKCLSTCNRMAAFSYMSRKQMERRRL
jgi:hypothetical protein